MKRVVFILALFLGLAARAGLAQQSITLPLADQLKDGRRIGFWLPVQVADGPPALMLVDTGSRGMIVMAERLGQAVVKRTGKRITQSFMDGSVFRGEIVLARVRFGPVETPQPVPVLAVEKTECRPEIPDCPVRFFRESGVAGIMGIGIGNATLLENPLAYLPFTVSNGFILHGGNKTQPASLTLGLTPANSGGFTYSPVAKGRAAAGGRSAFFDQNAFPACLTIEGSAVSDLCGTVLFDSGSSLSILHIPPGLKPAWLPANGVLPLRNVVGVSIPGLPDYHTATGEGQWNDRYKVVLDPDGRSILGAGLFKHFGLLYDLRRQTIGIRPAR